MKKIAFRQASLVATYIIAIALLMFNMGSILGSGPDTFLAPIIGLLLFSSSALICGLLVFYTPYKLFFKGKKEEAIDLVLWTAGILFGYFLLALFVGLVVR